jgi:hypothetical protein
MTETRGKDGGSTVGENGKLNELDLDLRVRDRLMASGALKPEAIEGYLAGLPDVEAHCEAMAIDQPALGSGSHSSRVEPALDDNEGLE